MLSEQDKLALLVRVEFEVSEAVKDIVLDEIVLDDVHDTCVTVCEREALVDLT